MYSDMLKYLMCIQRCGCVKPYFFGYKREFSFLNNAKDLDPSYKMDLDLWCYLGRAKFVLQQNFIGLI